jgi:Protein of unknown function with HXXEE motif
MSSDPGTRPVGVPGLSLFPALLALHIAEEAPGFTRWAQRHASPRYTQRDFVQINAAGLAMTVVAGALVRRSENRALFVSWYTAVLTQQALFNPLFHAGTTVAFREYSPGLLTSLALPPVWIGVTRTALREGRVGRRSVVAATAIGGAIHAAAVARQVFKV